MWGTVWKEPSIRIYSLCASASSISSKDMQLCSPCTCCFLSRLLLKIAKTTDHLALVWTETSVARVKFEWILIWTPRQTNIVESVKSWIMQSVITFSKDKLYFVYHSLQKSAHSELMYRKRNLHISGENILEISK